MRIWPALLRQLIARYCRRSATATVGRRFTLMVT
jgi:hypothetical protein